MDDSGAARPTVIFIGGFVSTLVENYFVAVRAALRRGYNVLSVDGPGQGANLRRGPEWEAVLTPVVEFALDRSEVDADQMVVIGQSLGGYLAARAVAFEHRIAACVLNGGIWDAHRLCDNVNRGAPATPGGLAELMAGNAHVRWTVDNARWTLGVQNWDEVSKAFSEYTLAGVVDGIKCPTLVLDPERLTRYSPVSHTGLRRAVLPEDPRHLP